MRCIRGAEQPALKKIVIEPGLPRGDGRGVTAQSPAAEAAYERLAVGRFTIVRPPAPGPAGCAAPCRPRRRWRRLTCFLPARGPAARGPGAAGALPRRPGLFDVGGRGDKSFNDAAWGGISRAGRELGVTTEILEPRAAPRIASAAMRLFAARGFDLVIGVGFIFSTDVNLVAAAFPRTRFACIDYDARPGRRGARRTSPA